VSEINLRSGDIINHFIGFFLRLLIISSVLCKVLLYNTFTSYFYFNRIDMVGFIGIWIGPC
jgi:hypothetical protein